MPKLNKMPRVARLIHQCYSFVVSLIGWLANLEVCSFNEEEVPGGGGRRFHVGRNFREVEEGRFW